MLQSSLDLKRCIPCPLLISAGWVCNDAPVLLPPEYIVTLTPPPSPSTGPSTSPHSSPTLPASSTASEHATASGSVTSTTYLTPHPFLSPRNVPFDVLRLPGDESAPVAPIQCTVAVNKRLTAEDWDQDVRHLELDTPPGCPLYVCSACVSVESFVCPCVSCLCDTGLC